MNTDKKQRSIAEIALSTAVYLAVIAGIVYFANQLESIEDQLSYQPPKIDPLPANQGLALSLVDGQRVYVPVYSHIYANGGAPHLLETTLSIRNSDPDLPIAITSARYYDTAGNLIKEFVDGTLRLGPLATTEIVVKKRDTRGGSGANFIVEWVAEKPVYEPIIETVMLGQSGSQSISFKSAGRPLVERSSSGRESASESRKSE